MGFGHGPRGSLQPRRHGPHAAVSESPSWSELAFGDATLALHISHGGGSGATGLSFEVDDIEAACRAAERGGGRVVQAPQNGDIPGLTLADIADPDGNRIQLGHHGG